MASESRIVAMDSSQPRAQFGQVRMFDMVDPAEPVGPAQGRTGKSHPGSESAHPVRGRFSPHSPTHQRPPTMSTLATAIRIAAEVHERQRDKGGAP